MHEIQCHEVSSYPRHDWTPSLGIQPVRPLGPWLRLLSLLLIIWGPCELALVTASALSALAVRGPSLAIVMVVRLAAAAFGIAAGLALASRRSAALTMTRASLVVTAAVDTIVYLTPIFPSNRIPGDERLYVAATVIYAIAWLLYLWRSRHVSAIFARS